MPNLHFEHDGICRGCALKKNAKKCLPSADRRLEEILELVHLDLCGPVLAISLSGFLYYVIFIDGFS